jgi:hypothetical protein
VAKKNVVAATALVSSTEAFPTAGLALQLEVPTVMTSIPSLKVGEECWNPDLDGRLEVVAANISYHVIHLTHIIISIRLISYHKLHLPVLVPQKVARHKSFFSKVSRHLILQQHPSILTPTARATCFTTATS